MKQTILLVEDDQDDVDMFQEALMEISPNSNLLLAENGIAGIETLKSVVSIPDFIFLDINMPFMNGLEFLKIIKEHQTFFTIPAFMLTTSNENDVKEKALESGAAGFFSKPSRYEDLKEILSSVILNNAVDH